MAWQDLADRVLKKTIDTFKTDAVFIPADGSDSYAIQGVFNRPYQGVDLQNNVTVTSIHPTFGVRLADLATEPTEGDQITIGNDRYLVLDSQRDGEGGSALTLQRVG